MRIITLILLTATVACSQPTKKEERQMITAPHCIKVGNGQAIFSGVTVISYVLNNKHFYIKSSHITLDLRIVERSAQRWIGLDKYKNAYSITAMEIGGVMKIIIVPNDMTVGLMGVEISDNYQACF